MRRQPGAAHADKGARQVRTLGDEDREMEEAGADRRARRGAGRRRQLDERRALVHAQLHQAVLAREHAQPDRALVEARERLGIRRAQAHGADPCVRRDRHLNSAA